MIVFIPQVLTMFFSRISKWIVDYFRIIFLAAIGLGLVLPQYISSWYGLLTPFIIILMYLGALDIEYNKLNSLMQYWKRILLYYVVMMIILPIILFYILSQFSVDIAIGVYLLSVAPAGIAAIAFTRLMGGNVLLGLCLAVVTTVSLPLVLPLMTKYIVGSSIQIDAWAMFIDLILFCVLPILVAYLTQRYAPKIIGTLHPHLDRVSILLIAVMIAGPVAYNADTFLETNIEKLLLIVGGLFLLSALIHTVGRICFTGTPRENKITGSLAKGFMNISITTVLAAKYFGPEVLLVVMLYEFPRDLMLIPFRRFVNNKISYRKES